MNWTYKGKEITEVSAEYEGFVYLITNLTDNRKYVGKKLSKFKTTKPPLKGKKNKSCLLYTSPSPRDATLSRMPSSA